MGKIVIYRNGSAHLNLVERGKVTITDATFNRAMLSDDSVTLKVNSSSVLDIKVNDYFTLFGENYRINQLPTFTKNSNSSYEYQIVAQGLMYDLLRCKFFNADGEGFKTTLDFPLIGNLELFLTVIANNMKRFSDKWEFKSYPFQKGETKTLTFGSDTCLSALQKICQEFKTDFWVKSENGKFVIHTGDFGNNIPVTFEHGKGNGLYALSRSNVNEEGVINRMYVEGSSENLPNNYRNFSDRLKFSDAGYLEDANLIAEMGLKEGELKLDDIYPSRTGKVTSLGGTKFKFIDNTMDFDLNEKEADGITTKYLKPDTTAKIHFNTGNLAGYEFEIKKGGYKHATKEFEIIPITTSSGQKIPDLTSGAFQFAVGDEYVLIDIYAPEIYITNAENKLLAKATEQFALKKQVEVSYDLIVDPEFIKKLQTKINVGDYVRVKDAKLGVDKVIRVNSIAQNFIKGGEWRENDYKITIADTYEISYASQMILDVREIKNVNNITNQGEINYSLIGMKSTRELQSMVFDTDGYFDPINIKPNSIETNMLTVGSQSQQLSCSVVFRVNADGLKNKIVSDAGKLFSQTLNKTWDIPALIFNVPDDVARYVYAKCSKTGTAGSVVYDSAQRKFDEDPNYFYFLVGVLHSVVDGVRVLSLTYGTTTIIGGLIRAGVISSTDGQTYFNLNTGEIAGKITFKSGSTGYNNIIDAPDLSVYDNMFTNLQGQINSANVILSDIASDNKLTPSEKQVTVNEWNRIKSEYTQNFNTANSLGISITDYQTAYNALSGYITPLLTDLNSTSDIVGVDFRTMFQNYYTTCVAIVTAISQKQISNIQIGGRNLLQIGQLGIYSGGIINLKNNSFNVDNYNINVISNPSDLVGINIDGLQNVKSLMISGKTTQGSGNWYYKFNNSSQVFLPVTVTNGRFEFRLDVPNGATSLALGLGSYPFVSPYTLSQVKVEVGNKATDFSPAIEDIARSITDANTNASTALAQAINAQNTASSLGSKIDFLSETKIDGNTVATGSLVVGSATGANAGITGVVDRPNGNSVRFFAGSTYAGKNTANWLIRDDGVEEQWFNGVLVRQRGVINGAYVEVWYNLNGQIGKKITFSTDGKILEEWYNNGTLVYQIGQNGIYYVAEIPESFNYKGLVNCNTNLIQSNLEFLEAPLRQMMYQKTTDPRRFELRANKNSYLYNAGQNVYSDGNKQYDGFKNSKSKTDTVPNGWYAYEILGFMLDDGVDSTRRFANAFRTEDGKIVQSGIVTIETNGYTFNQF